MNKKLKQLIDLLKEELGLLLSISFGIYLFVLFFQPFPISRFDFNNMLLFEAGLAGIIFLFMILIRITYPWLVQNFGKSNYEHIFPSYMGGFIMLALSSAAFAFYMHYVGSVSITFYIMFKVCLICPAPPVILGIYDIIKELRQQNESLIEDKKIILKQVEKYEEDYLNISVEFISENKNENLDLLIADIAFIKSADNYVEIVYKEGDNFMKKVLNEL